MIYIMLGGPATGKGTRSEILSNELNIPHISTGEILREKSNSDLNIKEQLKKGMLISDDIINEMLFNRLKQEDCKKGFVLDGYPRKMEQVYALEDMLKTLNMEITEVIELQIPKELAFKRILERKECPKCGKAFGIDFPSKNGTDCDNCGEKLIVRSDDTKEVLEKRIETYNKMSKPIIEYYKNKNIHTIVDASNHPERVLKSI
jgi:adenylate kinase